MESKLYALRVIGDSLSYSVILGTFMKILPPIAALVSILWVGFQFYHSPPVKEWRQRRKEK